MAKRSTARPAKAAKRARPKDGPKPPTPKLEAAILWAAVARLAAKRAGHTAVALEVGDYKVHGTLRAEVLLGPRRKPRAIEAVLSADVDVDPPRSYSAMPRERPLLAGLLAALSDRAAKEVVAALPKIRGKALTDDQLQHAAALLKSITQERPGKDKRVGVDGVIEEVCS